MEMVICYLCGLEVSKRKTIQTENGRVCKLHFDGKTIAQIHARNHETKMRDELAREEYKKIKKEQCANCGAEKYPVYELITLLPLKDVLIRWKKCLFRANISFIKDLEKRERSFWFSSKQVKQFAIKYGYVFLCFGCIHKMGVYEHLIFDGKMLENKRSKS